MEAVVEVGGEAVALATKGAFAWLACIVGEQGVCAAVLVAALLLELVVVEVEWLSLWLLSSKTTLSFPAFEPAPFYKP